MAGHHCVTLSPERHVGFFKIKNSPDPPHQKIASTSQITCPEEQQIKACIDVGKLSLCSNKICGQLKPDHTPTADVFDSDQRVVLQTARDVSWQDPLTHLGLSMTPQSEQA